MDKQKIKTFKVFYKFYLIEHKNKISRLLHVVGTTIVLAIFLTSLYHGQPKLLIFLPIVGYGFAWVGHFFFEKNKPATFKYPLWSLKADFVMWYAILSGKLSLDSSKDLEH